MSDPVYDAAGAELTSLASDGGTWVTTYGLPAAGVALAAGFVIALIAKYGKKVRSWI